MDDIIEVNNEYYILATSSRIDDHARVLKHDDLFAVFDQYGDIQPLGLGEEGLYFEGTRFLNGCKLTLNGRQPLLLSSTVMENNTLLTVDLTNPDLKAADTVVFPRETVHILRECFLWRSTCYLRLRVRNYALHDVQLSLRLSLDADFVDIFEVRGTKRAERGRRCDPAVEPDRLVLAYRGLDDVLRRTVIRFSPAPDRLNATAAWFDVHLAANEERAYEIAIECRAQEGLATVPFEKAVVNARQLTADARRGDAVIDTTDALFNAWLTRSAADLHMMATTTDDGPYPYAGVPWFSTIFGRDGIITALEYLWINPDMARAVLSYLAKNQATEVIPQQDAEPGKILHETRRGEMAALGEIPFGKYYGSVDATPLFVILAGAYYERTADLEFVAALWPNVQRALAWIDDYGDQDGDGFVEYARQSPNGLVSQGWKDSVDAVFHADGSLAAAPLALAEVQGYVYAARLAAARLAEALGDTPRADELRTTAARLRRDFDQAFWCDELATYALAIDADKQPCRVRASNAGQCLFSGIARPERAPRLAQTLLDGTSFSGWGIRTVATGEKRFNPMAYHNGSIWPHDNALIAHGLSRYGLQRAALEILRGLFDASTYFELRRTPELFCGFPRRNGEGPTLYPVACSPQSWAAAAVFYILQSCLGLTIDAPRRQVRFTRPVLPESLSCVTIKNLRVRDAVADLVLDRYSHDVGISVTRKEGALEIVAIK
ncbi:MAG TPA: glycogen debranching N-terminal domain-containing protein [Pirellulales bacterium]|nr:glycogen debranching N-terminal domain-containing protein [Pirellulales bacterium]